MATDFFVNVVGLPNPNHGQKISIAIEERSKKPTWEKPSRQNFIFLLQPIKGRSDFRAVYVVAVDPELIRIAREHGFRTIRRVVRYCPTPRELSCKLF